MESDPERACVSRRRYDGEQKTENRKFEKIRERKQSDFLSNSPGSHELLTNK